MQHLKEMTQIPEFYQLQALQEVDDFEMVFFKRLLPSFNDIEEQAKLRAENYLTEKSKNFNPEIDDELSILEDAYFEKINFESQNFSLKQDFINQTAVWLFHIFERRFNQFFDSYRPNATVLESFSFVNHDNLQKINDLFITFDELRALVNAIKHGKNSDAFNKVQERYPQFLDERNEIIISEVHIHRYIQSLKDFWQNAICVSK